MLHTWIGLSQQMWIASSMYLHVSGIVFYSISTHFVTFVGMSYISFGNSIGCLMRNHCLVHKHDWLRQWAVSQNEVADSLSVSVAIFFLPLAPGPAVVLVPLVELPILIWLLVFFEVHIFFVPVQKMILLLLSSAVGGIQGLPILTEKRSLRSCLRSAQWYACKLEYRWWRSFARSSRASRLGNCSANILFSKYVKRPSVPSSILHHS